MLKKKLFVFAILISILLGVHLFSYATTTGKITGETVKLREGPSTDTKLVVLLSISDEVEVIGKEGDWYQVKFQDKIGYVRQDFIKIDGEVAENNTEEKEQESANDNNVDNTAALEENTQYNNITKEPTQEQNNTNAIPVEKKIKADTKIYLLPVINASELGTLKASTKVALIQEVNGWGYIELEEFSGWMRVDQLEEVKKEQPKQEDPKQEEKKEEPEQKEDKKNTSKKGYVNVDTLNVRKEMNTTSEVVMNLSKNAEVIITGIQDNWYQIKTNGKQGYVYQKYISDKKQEVTNRSSSVRTPKEASEDTKQEQPASNTNSGSAVIEYAKQFLGYPYISGHKGPNSFDCSGFTYYVYKHFGITLNSSSSTQRSNGMPVAKANLQQGDLVFFTGHVGIYIGGNQFIHAANPGKGVVITSLEDSYYAANYQTARRVL